MKNNGGCLPSSWSPPSSFKLLQLIVDFELNSFYLFCALSRSVSVSVCLCLCLWNCCPATMFFFLTSAPPQWYQNTENQYQNTKPKYQNQLYQIPEPLPTKNHNKYSQDISQYRTLRPHSNQNLISIPLQIPQPNLTPLPTRWGKYRTHNI